MRLFWILVVIAGFSLAGYLISGAIEHWRSSPIKTTIETKQISELDFPKVTVCPPKGLYTNLNHDLVSLAKNKITLDNATRHELRQMMEQFLSNDEFETVVKEESYPKERVNQLSISHLHICRLVLYNESLSFHVVRMLQMYS